LLKADFDAAAVFGIHAAVIKAGGMRFGAQGLRQRFGFRPRAAIDDARLPPPRACKAQDLLARAIFDGKGKVDIGAIKAAQKGRGCLAVEQAGDDFGAGFFICCGGKSGQGHAQAAPQRADAQIIWPEIMAPLADAMSFINGK